jgi:uncharacterized protein DUF4386
MTPSVVEPQQVAPEPVSTLFADHADSAWKPLYRVGGGAALLSVVCIVVAIVVFLAWPPPTSIESWFALFQRNAFLGLLDLDLLLVTSYVVLIPLYLALYVALRRASQSFMAIALAFNLVGAALILGVNPGAAMLTLSDHYATATTDAQRETFLAAGQALITNWSGTAFVVGYLLGGIGVLITAAVMLRSKVFSKFIAYTGLVMGALMLIPASAGTVGLLLSLVSLAPTVVWLILVARRLFHLAASSEMDGYALPAKALER